LPSFAGIAVHDAWAPYDGYASADHQLCCAHALRELQAVTDITPAGQWCWATQAAGTITAMQALASEAERAYSAKAGARIPPRTPWHQQRATTAAALRAGVSAGAWPVRYTIRRCAWHVLDHAWEIEDKSV
jgi:hypothetical protein